MIVRLPSASTLPTSPECTKPLLSIVFLVYSSLLKYPIKVFRPDIMTNILPLRQISPFPSASGLSIAIVNPSMTLPAYLRNYLSVKFFHFDGFVYVYGPES